MQEDNRKFRKYIYTIQKRGNLLEKKILIVVDVQRAYSPFFTEEYVKQVETYMENHEWDEVIIRYIGEDEYSIINNEVGSVIHTFNEDSRYIPPFLNKESFRFSERFFGYELNEESEQIEIVPNKLYKVKEDDEWWFMSETPNGDMYCPCRVMESIINEDATVHIVGGFKSQCVKEVYDFLTWAGMKDVQIVDKYSFEEVEPNLERALRFTSEWIEPKSTIIV